VYRFDIRAHLGIHDVLNDNKLKLFELPLEDAIKIQRPMDNILKLQPPLLHDQDRKTKNT
jgi:hypothetical protein